MSVDSVKYIFRVFLVYSTRTLNVRKRTCKYLEYDGSSRLLLQNTWHAEGLQVGVGVVDEACVVVSEQSLDVVEDEAKLVHVFDRLLVCGVLCLQRGGIAAYGGGVQHFTHLGNSRIGTPGYTSHSTIYNLHLCCIKITTSKKTFYILN